MMYAIKSNTLTEIESRDIFLDRVDDSPMGVMWTAQTETQAQFESEEEAEEKIEDIFAQMDAAGVERYELEVVEAG